MLSKTPSHKAQRGVKKTRLAVAVEAAAAMADHEFLVGLASLHIPILSR